MSNPFDLGPMGGLGPMMAGLQQQMKRMQEEAEATQVEGQSGGGLVRVVATGAQQIVSIRMDPKVLDDPELVEDLLVAATNDALRRSKEMTAQKLGALAGAMGLPPGLF